MPAARGDAAGVEQRAAYAACPRRAAGRRRASTSSGPRASGRRRLPIGVATTNSVPAGGLPVESATLSFKRVSKGPACCTFRFAASKLARRRWPGALLCLLLGIAASAAFSQDSASIAGADALVRAGRHLEAAARYERLAHRGFMAWDVGLALLAAREYRRGRGIRRSRPDARQGARPGPRRCRPEAARAHGSRGWRSPPAILHVPSPFSGRCRTRCPPSRRWTARTARDGAIRRRTDRAGHAHVAGTQSAAGDVDGALRQRPAAARSVVAARPDIRGAAARAERCRARVARTGRACCRGPATRRDAPTRRWRAGLRDWMQRHPGHPGAAFLPGAVAGGPDEPRVAPGDAAATLAVVLPLTGRQQAAGTAVRDGVVASWFAPVRPRPGRGCEISTRRRGAPRRPTNARSRRARKSSSAAAQGGRRRGRQRALGTSAGADAGAQLARPDAVAPPRSCSSSRSIRNRKHARPPVASRADGLVRGIALFPDTTWGQRVQAAFTAGTARDGPVTLMSTQLYPPGREGLLGTVARGSRTLRRCRRPPQRSHQAAAGARDPRPSGPPVRSLLSLRRPHRPRAPSGRSCGSR